MFLKKLLSLPMLCIFMLPAVAPAAENGSATTELSPIVVTASRTPEHLNEVAQSVTIIDRADIDGSAADSVADLLEYASGVDVR
ncbi:MAG: hypothetical protein J7K75_03125, partial [Desulfuromonas sp.]|nr:hypothetical protein [Desulfuromonas sp.]